MPVKHSFCLTGMDFSYASNKEPITLKLKTIQKKRRTANTIDSIHICHTI